MALVGRRLEAFSFEHMAQMPAASCACDLYPPTIRVRRPLYSSWKPFEEGWPATAGVKLGGGFVQGRSTASTVVHPTTVELVVLACSRQLGVLEAEDAELLRGEDGPPLLLGLWLVVPRRHHRAAANPGAGGALRRQAGRGRSGAGGESRIGEGRCFVLHCTS